jgi:hypothetical protein
MARNGSADCPVALSGSIPAKNRRVPHIPDFLWSFVGSLNFMRLSLTKGAHAVLSRAAYRKLGASRSFFASCGDTTGFSLKPAADPTALNGCPTFAPALPGFLLRGTNHNYACGFLSKKAARSCSTPPTSTGNPGYVGRKRRAKPHHSLLFRDLLFVNQERSAVEGPALRRFYR